MRLIAVAAAAVLFLLPACGRSAPPAAVPGGASDPAPVPAAATAPSAAATPRLDPAVLPVQHDLPRPQSFVLAQAGHAYRVTGLARYCITGIVTSVTAYDTDPGALLSPCDIALVFGELALHERWRLIDWSQSGRWYWWDYAVPDFPQGDSFIIANSSNNHIATTDPYLIAATRSVRIGETIRLTGILVAVEETGTDGFSWRSSLSRTDTGDGSCEIIWLTDIARGDSPAG